MSSLSTATVTVNEENSKCIRLYEEMPNEEFKKHVLSNPNVKKELIPPKSPEINYIKPYWHRDYIYFENFIKFLIDTKRKHNEKIVTVQQSAQQHTYTIHEILDDYEFNDLVFNVYVVRDENDFWYHVIPVLFYAQCYNLTNIYKYNDEFIYYNKENDIFIHPYCVPHCEQLKYYDNHGPIVNIIVNGNKISFECPCCKYKIFKKEYVTNIEENKLNSLKPFIYYILEDGCFFCKLDDSRIIAQYKSNEINLDEIINVISPYRLNTFLHEEYNYNFETVSDSVEHFLKDCEEIP